MYDFERFPDGRAVVFNATTGLAHCIARNEAHARTICATLGFTTAGVKSRKRTDVTDSLIGSLAHATLEPMTAEPARAPGEHVTLDARNVDHWSHNHGR